MFVSPLASSTVPPTSLSGTEPSWRWTVGTQAYARSAASTSPAATSAIAASTWFQTSVWPPGTQGIAPEGSCTATMLAAVALTSCAVSTPARAGTSADIDRLAEVEHQRLADERVQHPSRGAQDRRSLGDLPDEQP